MPALAAGAAIRSQAAAWIAGQVSGDAMVACDPGMCAALQAQGIPAAGSCSGPAGSSGLAGLKDRVEALGGRIVLHSPPGRVPACARSSPYRHE